MPIGRPPTNAFQKGNTTNKDFLAKLTPEQRKAHYDGIQKIKQENRKKKDNTTALNDLYMSQQIELATLAFNATIVMLERALKANDVQAYNSAMNRIYGQVASNSNVTVETDAVEMIEAIKEMAGKLPD